MKLLAYAEMYDALRQAEAYHIRLIDGSLVQMLYTFEGREVTSHRLAFFPSPLHEMYEKIPESYEHEDWYTDMVGEFSVKVPVRFDYSSSDKEHINVDHPKSHMTLGQYKGCRIPVTAPLTPNRFMRFILRNFYNPAYSCVSLDEAAAAGAFAPTITADEKSLLHITP